MITPIPQEAFNIAPAYAEVTMIVGASLLLLVDMYLSESKRSITYLLSLALLVLGLTAPAVQAETLIDRVWGSDYVGDTKTLDVHVKRLRSKIEDDPANPTRIVTIRGLGYKYDKQRSA